MTDAGGPAEPLGYEPAGARRLKVGLYQAALVCWLLPLVAGVGTLAGYAWTFNDQLPRVGLLILCGGGALFVAGMGCLFAFNDGVRRSGPDLSEAWSARIARARYLLASNLLVAAACSIAGLSLMQYFPVTLVNQTRQPVADISVEATGAVATLARLEPGEKRRLLVSPRGEGQITFLATQNGGPVTGVAAGYVSAGSGGRSRVTFTDGGPVVVTNR